MEFKEIKELMLALEKSKLKKLQIKKGDEEILLEKESPTLVTSPEGLALTVMKDSSPAKKEEVKKKEEISSQPEGKFITSPMIGVFYPTPAPDQPPFVKVGDHVEENSVVCIIEAMKVMNELKAGMKGTVAEVLIEKGQPVEFGSRLFRIIP